MPRQMYRIYDRLKFTTNPQDPFKFYVNERWIDTNKAQFISATASIRCKRANIFTWSTMIGRSKRMLIALFETGDIISELNIDEFGNFSFINGNANSIDEPEMFPRAWKDDGISFIVGIPAGSEILFTNLASENVFAGKHTRGALSLRMTIGYENHVWHSTDTTDPMSPPVNRRYFTSSPGLMMTPDSDKENEE